ncbi:MAG: hypothetical protein F6K30_30045 [Cyanothece sp. SIO2G6]|nr:hypothetical protein [Cyanothece sp. SIO2G6]
MLNTRRSHPLLHRVSHLAIGTLLVTVSVGYSRGAIAAPSSSFSIPTNKDALSDLLGNDSPILDAITSVIADESDATGETATNGASTETSTEASTETNEETTAQSGGEASRSSDTASTDRFTCQYDNGEFVVMYSPESEPGTSYQWAIPGEMGGGWTPERRCNAIAERLEDYRPDGLLELQTGVENNYNIVCVTTTDAPGCRIVFTVPNDQDPIATRDRVFENLAIANSGQETAGVNTFTGNGSSDILAEIGDELGLNLPGVATGTQRRSAINRNQGIDLRPFLDPADGGTGANL